MWDQGRSMRKEVGDDGIHVPFCLIFVSILIMMESLLSVKTIDISYNDA